MTRPSGKISVLNVIHYGDFSGPSNQVVQLYRSLNDRDIELSTVLPDSTGTAAEKFKSAGIPYLVRRLGRVRRIRSVGSNFRYVFGFWRDVWKLRVLIRDGKFDIIQLNGLENLQAMVAAISVGRPVLVRIIATNTPIPMLVMATVLSFISRSVYWYTVGDSVADAQWPFNRTRKSNYLGVTYPSVDVIRFCPVKPNRKTELRKQFGIDSDAIVIGMVANFIELKRHVDLVLAVSSLKPDYPNLVVVLKGEQLESHREYFDLLGQTIAASTLLKGVDVIILDSDSDVAEIVSCFDISVIASMSEGVPTVMLESMANGLPIVSTRVGSVPQIVSQSVGKLVDMKSPKSIADAIRVMIGEELHHKLPIEQNREWVLDNCSVQLVAAELDMHYRRILTDRVG